MLLVLIVQVQAQSLQITYKELKLEELKKDGKSIASLQITYKELKQQKGVIKYDNILWFVDYL